MQVVKVERRKMPIGTRLRIDFVNNVELGKNLEKSAKLYDVNYS